MNRATVVPAVVLACALGLFAGTTAAVKPNAEVYAPPTTSSAGGPQPAGKSGSGTATTQGRPSTSGNPGTGGQSH
jgi:hypothetical protein